MDDSINEEDALETNWVFVEDVDIAEEALNLNSDKSEFLNADNESPLTSSQGSFEKLTKIKKSFSDSQLLNHEDNLCKDDKQLIDLDSESDGLSIVSNWSYSQGTPDNEILDDGIDNKEHDEGNPSGAEEEIEDDIEEESAIYTIKPFDCEIEELPNNADDEQQITHDDSQKILEEDDNCKHVTKSKDNIESDTEGLDKDDDEFHKYNEVDDTQEEPVSVSGRSFPTLSEDRILQNEHELLDQLRWLDEPPESIEDTSNDHTLHKYLVSKVPQCIKKHFSVTGFLIGTVLIAVSSVFLGRYFTARETIQEELPTYQENVFLYDVPSEDNFDVPTALSFCRDKHKTDDIYMEINAQKCLSKIEKRMKRKKQEKILREKIKSWEKELELKEEYLTEKERNLMKKEVQTPKEKNNERNREFENKYQSKIQKNYNENDSKEKQYKHNDKIVEKTLKMKEPIKNHQKYFKTDSKEKMNKNDGRKRDKFKLDDDKKYSSKERTQKGDDIKRDKYKTFDDDYEKGAHFKENKNRMKNKDIKFAKSENKKKQWDYTDEKFPKVGKKKCTNRSEIDGFCKNSKNECKNSKNKYKQKFIPNFVLLDKKNETVDGTWLGRLFKGREELRNNDKLGEWYFDRSSYRKRKRDKSGWYFDWMMDRELMRYRRLYLNI